MWGRVGGSVGTACNPRLFFFFALPGMGLFLYRRLFMLDSYAHMHKCIRDLRVHIHTNAHMHTYTLQHARPRSCLCQASSHWVAGDSRAGFNLAIYRGEESARSDFQRAVFAAGPAGRRGGEHIWKVEARCWKLKFSRCNVMATAPSHEDRSRAPSACRLARRQRTVLCTHTHTQTPEATFVLS